MTDFQDLNPRQRETARLVAGMRYSPPPPDLAAGVMRRVAATRRRTLWQRMFGWFVTPQNIRVRPWIPAAAFAALIVFMAGSGQFYWRTLLQHEPAGTPDRGGEVQASLPADGTVEVAFSIHVTDAKKVALIGSFNNWQKHGVELRPSAREGWWTVSLPLKRGRYEYAFVLDGMRVVPDPDSLLNRDDGFGNLNSVIIVEDYAKRPLSSLHGA